MLKKFLLALLLFLFMIIFSLIDLQSDSEISSNFDDYVENNNVNENEEIEDLNINYKVIGKFSELLSLNANETELLEFISIYHQNINNNTLSLLIIKFIGFQFNNLSIHDQMIQNDNIQNSLIDEYGINCKILDLKKLDDIQLRNRLNSLYMRGYIISFDNGKFHLKINYNYFMKYEEKLNNELITFLEIKNNTYNAYENIRIQWEYVYNNIYISELFLNKFSNSILYPEIYSIYINNVDFLLYGTDYVNIFDEQNKLIEELQEQYKEIVLNEKETIFSNIFSSYYSELINSEFTLDVNIHDKRESLFNIIKEKYKKNRD